MSIELIYKLIACHFIGDYLFQQDFIASTKGQNWYHLLIHCVLYSVPFYLCFGGSIWLFIITALHFPIDVLKARYKKINYVTDQILHFVLLAAYALLGGLIK